MKKQTIKKANEILALFAYWNLTPEQSLEVIAMVRKKIKNMQENGSKVQIPK